MLFQSPHFFCSIYVYACFIHGIILCFAARWDLHAGISSFRRVGAARSFEDAKEQPAIFGVKRFIFRASARPYDARLPIGCRVPTFRLDKQSHLKNIFIT